jgi:PAS domain S-box-containing protein
MRRPTTIGIISPDLGSIYFGSLFFGMYTVAHPRGVRLLAIQATPDEVAAKRLAWEQVDGWLIAVDTTGAQQLERSQKPIVTVSGREEDQPYTAVIADNYGGMRAAVQHVIEHGHQRIAFVGNLTQHDMRVRYDAYRATLSDNGIMPDPGLFFATATNHETSGREAAHRLLQAGCPCTAIVVDNDHNAIGLLEGLQAAGCRVPQDVAVVSFDDVNAAQFTMPPLTTVRQRPDVLGAKAAEILLAQIAGQGTHPNIISVPSALIIRRSCGCPPIAPQLVTNTPEDLAERWQARLAHQLVQLAAFPMPVDSSVPPTQTWPGVAYLIQALEAALQDTAPPTPAQMHRAWEEVLELTTDLDVLHSLTKLIEQTAMLQLSAIAQTTTTRMRIDTMLDQMRKEMLHARILFETTQLRTLNHALQGSYAISTMLLDEKTGTIQDLAWLQQMPMQRGCFSVWRPDSAGDPAALVVTGTYAQDGDRSELPAIGTSYAAPLFPPSELLIHDRHEREANIVIVRPIQTPKQDIGILALVGPIAYLRFSDSYDTLNSLATLIGAAWERETLLNSLKEQQDTIRRSYDRERALAATSRQAEMALRKSEAQQQALIDAIPDLMLRVHRDGVILSFKPSKGHMLPQGNGDVVGKTVDEVLPPMLAQAIRRYATEQLPTGEIAVLEYQVTDNGQIIDHEARIIVSGDQEILAIVRDITERKKVERMKHEFVSIVSHELRTPLTSIRGALGLVANGVAGAIPPQAQTMINIAHTNSERLVRLINDILDIEKIESGHMLFDLQPIALLPVVEQAIADNRAYGAQFGVTFILEATAPDVHVNADRDRLLQVLTNLLSNAAKFSLPNSTVTVAVTRLDSCVQIGVADRGFGIPEEFHNRIFQKFAQADSSDTRRKGGTGLGLSITKAIVERCGGRIWFTSEVGHGTTFYVDLPEWVEPAGAATSTQQPDQWDLLSVPS